MKRRKIQPYRVWFMWHGHTAIVDLKVRSKTEAYFKFRKLFPRYATSVYAGAEPFTRLNGAVYRGL